MATLVLLLLAIGLAPLALGAARSRRARQGRRPSPDAGSVILCALAFNLTFLWQELWLVIPKALTPGLHPVLYHNDHAWTGHAATVELLQGTGALATLASGLAFGVGLAFARRLASGRRAFLFWMAFEGLYQSLTQLAIGALLPGNDVGRALAYLHVAAAGRWTLLALAVVAMAFAGVWLARQSVGTARAIAPTSIVAVALIIPFRLPRDLVEVAFIPLFVHLVGAGWVTLGGAVVPDRGAPEAPPAHLGIFGPALALALTLLAFQIVLRPGVVF
jgi:hypothetical protein